MTARAPHGWQDPEQFAAPVEPLSWAVQADRPGSATANPGGATTIEVLFRGRPRPVHPRHDRRWLVLVVVLVVALIWRKRL